MKSLQEFLESCCGVDKSGSAQCAANLNIKDMEGTLSKTVDNDEENNSKNNPKKGAKPSIQEQPEQVTLRGRHKSLKELNKN